jgi:CheY-like chemotaxis protein
MIKPTTPPRDDAKKQVSELLRRVDQFIKVQDLSAARAELDEAKKIDAHNVYVFAFEERLNYLVEEKKRIEVEAEIKKAEEENRKRLEAEQRRLDEERRKQEEERRKEEEERRRAEKTRQEEEVVRLEAQRRAEQESAVSEEDRKKEERRRLEEQLKAEAVKLAPKVSRADALRAYRETLIDVWSDGAATDEEELTLLVLRASLSISHEEHIKIENEAKKESYYNALRRAWSTGNVTQENARILTDLRAKFRIAQEEHDKIEAKLLAELRVKREKATVFVVDDEEKLLQFLSDLLTEEGFDVKAFSTTDEAYKSLKETPPDLILSDINLETSTMGGFTFFEKVRELRELHHVPFIFLSGLNDEVLIRAGKELGVDDYLTKPFAEETLVATIRGKIRRSQQLRALSRP